MIEQTKHIMSQLKLFGMLESLDPRLSEATSNGWGHVELVSSLISDEKADRDNRQAKRRLKAARFRNNACFERFDLQAKRNFTKTQLQDLMQLNFIKQKTNLLILGPTGVGKTFLASAIGEYACRKGYTCRFLGVNLFIEQLAMARADGTYLRYRDRLINCNLLILDDLGIRTMPANAIQDLYDILEERYQKQSTIITSQLPVENWKEVIQDAVALEAILDRLIHGMKLTLKGETYRKINGKQQAVDKT